MAESAERCDARCDRRNEFTLADGWYLFVDKSLILTVFFDAAEITWRNVCRCWIDAFGCASVVTFSAFGCRHNNRLSSKETGTNEPSVLGEKERKKKGRCFSQILHHREGGNSNIDWRLLPHRRCWPSREASMGCPESHKRWSPYRSNFITFIVTLNSNTAFETYIFPHGVFGAMCP